MAVINTNVKALYTQYALKNSSRAQTVAMEQLSTGKRINSARDDAAGMAIAKRMSQQIRSLDMAIRNAGDAVALIQTAEGATGTITDMLQRMRELAIQAMNDTNAQDQRGYLDLEFQQLKQQIVTISEHTQWNGFSILNGSVGEPVGERPVYKVVSSSLFVPADQIYDENDDLNVVGLREGDLVFVQRATDNTPSYIQIAQSKASSDGLSTFAQNASAIAIAAAINDKTAQTGVAAVVNQNIMDGQPMLAQADGQTGTIVINGARISVSTISNNTYETRIKVVEAINAATVRTGVVAVDSGTDSKGIQLIAQDGRNIHLEFDDTSIDDMDAFEAAIGLREGLQLGSYSLEARVETPIEVQSAPQVADRESGGSISFARLVAGQYTENVSTLVTSQRATVSAPDADELPAFKALRTGDLVINGVKIPGTSSLDDTVSDGTPDSSSTNASALAIANAINSQNRLTGVTATAIGPAIQGGVIAEEPGDVDGSITLNGVVIDMEFTDEDEPVDRITKVIDRINEFTYDGTGVIASRTDQGTLKLQTIDGRNLSIWTALDLEEIGLGGLEDQVSAPASYQDATTFYGQISLTSTKAFEVRPGANGFEGNFSALGFQQGIFGGAVSQAESKMTPPNVGRLTFHVGASATQTIHIDFADYGSKGPITGEITGDVELWNSEERVNRIDNAESARAVLAKIDTALDKVNGNRAVMGAVMNRLDYVMENLSNVSMNTSASRSQIEDADYAKASTELARTQIMQQAATAVLAQANMDQQTVLKLLQ